MEFALMFNVLDGGVSEPIPWDKDALKPDRSVIILDESTLTLFLWHGAQRGLVQRRTALRQAESLKGHGFTVGKSIIGRDVKTIKEIDARKVGRVPEETEMNEALQKILGKEFKVVESHMITFSIGEEIVVKPTPKPAPKAAAKAEPKVEPKVAPKVAPKEAAKPTVKEIPKPAPKERPEEPKKVAFASEYDDSNGVKAPAEKPAPAVKSAPAAKATPMKSDDKSLLIEARVAFVIKAVMSRYDDIWVSKKGSNQYAVEMMDGPICSFSIEGENVKFSQNSFSGISTDVKTEIQKKFAELSKLL